VGMKGLRTILYSYGTQKILGEKYSEMKELWEHSYRTALYAYILARSLKHLHDHLDDIYAAGILHDLGLIVVSGLHPDLQEKIRRFCRDKDIPIKLLENFSYGLNHADIGGLIATKWNFPPELIEGVRYHHEPLRSSAEHKNIVFAVYLANALCDIERGNLSFEQIETPVLRDFGIVAEQQLSRIHAKLREVYERQSKRT
jgi:HD-like signal output (HDOD) protein